MATLIFRLRHVPDNEAEAIRNLLNQHDVDWYETTAGNWGIAMPGIWIVDDQQVATARQLIDSYQLELGASQRDLYDQQKRLGQTPTLLERVLEHPLCSLGIAAFCLFILYVSIHPFIQMINYSNQ